MAEQESNSQNSRRKSPILGYLQIAFVIAIIVVALILARAPARIERDLDPAAETPDANPTTVTVIGQPESERITLQVEKTGNVTLEERVTVRTEAQGRVAWVSEKFKGGRSIPANEVFVKIDAGEYLLRVDEAEALLELARLKQASAEKIPDADDSRMDARVRLLETRLDKARLDLAKTEISLPYDIRVINSDIEVGEVVGPHEYAGVDSSVLGSGYRLEALQVSAPLEVQLLEDLHPVIGRRAVVTVGSRTYGASIDRVSNFVAPETRLIKVIFRFDEDIAGKSLPLPGMFAELSIDGPIYQDVYALPLNTMQPGRNAWVVSNGVLASINPTTIAITDDNWIVEPFDTEDGLVVGSYPTLFIGEAVTATGSQ